MRPLFLSLVACLVLVGAADAQTPKADAGTVVTGPFEQAKREIDLVKASGASWVALGSSWGLLEPEPGSHNVPGGAGSANWADLEARVGHAKSLGLNVFLQLTGAPGWARSGSSGVAPPSAEGLPRYGQFLSDLANRLGGSIDAYSPWNEPNHPHFWSRPDAAAYTRLQQTAYAAIKAGDPSALVLSAPIAPTGPGSGTIHPYDFLTAAYEAGLKGSIDVLAWNAYPPGAPEDEIPDGQGRPYAGSLPGQLYVKGILDRFDPGRKIWLTEFGWSTCSGCAENNINGTNEATQADYLLRAFSYRRRHLEGAVERIFWFMLRDGPDRARWNNNHGLVRHDWSLKPSYLALQSLSGPEASAPPATPVQPAGPPTQAGVVPRALPRAAVASRLPSAARGTKGRSVSIGRPSIVFRNGRLVVTFTMRVRGGASRVLIEGFRVNRWVKVSTLRVQGTARIRARIRDRGYLSLRLKARLPGSTRYVADRVIIVPRR